MKVSRQTVHRWFLLPEFQAGLNAGRNDLRRELETRLEILASRAVANVDQKIDEGDSGVSLAVLRGLGLLAGRRSEVGSELPEEIRDEQESRRMLASLVAFGRHESPQV